VVHFSSGLAGMLPLCYNTGILVEFLAPTFEDLARAAHLPARTSQILYRRSAPLLVLLRSRRAPWFSILFGTCIPWEEDERGNEWEGKGTTERLEPG